MGAATAAGTARARRPRRPRRTPRPHQRRISPAACGRVDTWAIVGNCGQAQGCRLGAYGCIGLRCGRLCNARMHDAMHRVMRHVLHCALGRGGALAATDVELQQLAEAGLVEGVATLCAAQGPLRMRREVLGAERAAVALQRRITITGAAGRTSSSSLLPSRWRGASAAAPAARRPYD